MIEINRTENITRTRIGLHSDEEILKQGMEETKP